MANQHFNVPPEALALLDDPRTAELTYLPPPMPHDFRVLVPEIAPKFGESRFVILTFEESDFVTEVFSNGVQGLSSGKGLDAIREVRPRLFTELERPAQLPAGWFSSGVIVASPTFAKVLREFGGDVIDTVNIDFTCANGHIEGYAFLDVRRVIHAYDWRRSEVRVARNQHGNYIAGLGQARALKRDIESGVHVFRDAYASSEVFVSREVATALRRAGLDDVYFYDPATMGYADI